jgi:hypothetical protein
MKWLWWKTLKVWFIGGKTVRRRIEAGSRSQRPTWATYLRSCFRARGRQSGSNRESSSARGPEAALRRLLL